MSLQLVRPLVVLDTETTGTEAESARIVELAMRRIEPDAPGASRWESLIHPGMPIPPAATAVHGITDADVRGKPHFGQIAQDVVAFLRDADVMAYNARYDLKMLDNEFHRCGLRFDIYEGRHVIDPMRLFYLREPRDLAAAVRKYVGREHEGAHRAMADVIVTLDVLLGQLEAYADLPRDVPGLAALCADADAVDREGKFRWAGDDVVLGFGKYRGVSIQKVDPGFLRWMLGQSFPADAKAIAREALEGRYPKR